MNSIYSFLDKPVFQALGWTLVHFAWEAGAVALLVLVARSAIKKNSASLRYAVSSAGLLALLVAPVVTFALVYAPSSVSHKSAPVSHSARFSGPAAATHAAISGLGGDVSLGSEQPAASNASSFFGVMLKQWVNDRLDSLLPWFVGVWLLGVLLLSSRFAGGLLIAHRLKTTGIEPAPGEWQAKLIELKGRLRVSRPVRLYKSLLVEVPTVVGWLRPVILLPVSAITGLSADQLEALLAHELAHIRRYDYLINIIQTAAETLLFYHPAVWWISNQVRAERENCCDDMAVAACGDVLTYARALAELESMRSRRPQLAMAADGGSLLHRIERLVGKAGSPKRHQVGPSLAVLAAIATVMIVLAGAGGVEPVIVRGAVQQARIMGIVRLSGAAPSGSDSHSQRTNADAAPTPTASATAAAYQPGQSQPSPQVSSDLAPAPAPDPQPQGASPQSENAEDYIGALDALGYKNLSVDDLIALKMQGVTPDYIKQIRAAGYDKLTVRQLVALRTMGVSPDYIKQMAGAGYPNLPVRELISLKSQEVTPEYIRGLADHGFSNLSASKLIGMKVQGVTPEYIDVMKGAGYDKLSASDLIALKTMGVTPEYIKEMKSTGLDDLSARALIGMKTVGVSADYVKQMRAIGFGGNSAQHFISMRTMGVDPAYVKTMKDAGLKDLNDRDIISLKSMDVSLDFIRELSSAGYSNLSIRQLISFRAQGVNPDYINELKSAGYSGLSAEELISLRAQAVDSKFIKRMHDHGFKNLTVRQLIQLKIAGIE